MKARLFWIHINTLPRHDKKRTIHWIPRILKFKIVSDDLKYEWWGYEILWLNLVIHLDLEHDRKLCNIKTGPSIQDYWEI